MFIWYSFLNYTVFVVAVSEFCLLFLTFFKTFLKHSHSVTKILHFTDE